MMNLPATTTLAERICHIRRDCFGDDGGLALAKALGLPLKTWTNYEDGIAMPATVLLAFVALTSANPLWLLNGEGAERLTRGGPEATPWIRRTRYGSN